MTLELEVMGSALQGLQAAGPVCKQGLLMHTCRLYSLPLHVCQIQHIQGGLRLPCHILSAKQKQSTPQQGSLQQQGQEG